MYAAESRGDVPAGTADEWESHTAKGKDALPEKVKTKKRGLRRWARAVSGSG